MKKIEEKNLNQHTTSYNDLDYNDTELIRHIIALSNGNGGNIMVGIDNITGSITGVSNESLDFKCVEFQNYIGSLIQPKVSISISFQDYGAKTVIILQVNKGNEKPYYIKSKGLLESSYVLIDSSIISAPAHVIQELILDGKGESFDEMIVPKIYFSETYIKKISGDITRIAKANAKSIKLNGTIKQIDNNMLKKWKLIKTSAGKTLGSYGFHLLTDTKLDDTFSSIDVNVFKGFDKRILLKSEVVTQSIITQPILINQLISTHTNISEELINSNLMCDLVVFCIVNRSYVYPYNITIDVFDDRIDFLIPGVINWNNSLESLKAGINIHKNKSLQQLFTYMGLMKYQGSGIRSINNLLETNGYNELNLSSFNGNLKITLSTVSLKNRIMTKDNQYLKTLPNDKEQLILDMFKEDPYLTQLKISLETGIDINMVKYHLKMMKQKGFLKREGTNQKGHWIVTIN